MGTFAQFGNDLYTGKRSYNIVGRRKLWYIIAAIMILVSILGPIVRGGFTFGIEFSGGSEFQVVAGKDPDQQKAIEAVDSVVPGQTPRVMVVGSDTVRIQTEQLTDEETGQVRKALAETYNVEEDTITSSFIGASWGQDITRQAILALIVFIVFAAVVMALYFRTWKMSLAAIIALLHDLVITAGVYGITGFEITPAAMIGFLTILGYSLYDTVVVFDKIRENTGRGELNDARTFGQSVNLAVNQTLVRSINTSVVALLPVASILFIGAFILGAGTLRDISLALFIGILVGTYSTIFIAAPTYAHLRENEPEIVKHDNRVRAREAANATEVEKSDADATSKKLAAGGSAAEIGS
ncbi:protein translocase subunit SecF [Lysinibacter cavernae]|uniref:Protein-export membrane protein SecF n=1 Tax=Lysinibacter cavernae TaxID=1640652 RepID=A0A7X5QZ59_9MICO|nr:protein translocase subunit SecF [Lysinibacter cavernae]NIH52694.1 preprotein translocase subunit SecF [Lysinibacter cavernae]